MPSRKAEELRALTTPDLERELHDAETDLLSVRFGLATRQTENTSRLKDARRQIARIKTLLNERQLEEA